jgi:hypothetical protein
MATMYRVRTLWTGTPVVDGITTLHYDAAGGSAQDAIDATADLFSTWTPFLAALQIGRVDETVDLIDMATGSLTGQTVGVTADIPTTGSEEALSPANQMLVRLHTDAFLNGRQVKGRIFVPGLTELANVGGGFVDGSLISGSASALGSWVSGADAVPVVWHRPKTPGTGAFFPVLSATIWPTWAILKNRRPGT